MTHYRQLRGKHWEEAKGSWLDVKLYCLLGIKRQKLKTKVVYRGLKKK